jgi:plastocyanin
MTRPLTLCCCFSLLLAACSQNTRPIPEKSSEQKAAVQKKLTVVDPATASTIRGNIQFTGKPPAPIEIDMGMDPGCTIANPEKNFSQQFVVGKGGGLANVYVYIKEGLEGQSFAIPSTPVVLGQKGCRYEPHVLALMAGQTLRIENSDPTMHNIHAQPSEASNPEWNLSQAPKAASIDKTFHDPEVMMPIKCNQHPWMKAYVNVAANPFYAVTDVQGNFEIAGLPPGDYTIAAVHEALGEQTQKISVGMKESKTVDFSYAEQ